MFSGANRTPFIRCSLSRGRGRANPCVTSSAIRDLSSGEFLTASLWFPNAKVPSGLLRVLAL